MPSHHMPPKVSIVTPSYNQGDFLEETIQSVLSQDYPNIEYIVIDGGSNDQSIDIIRKYEKQIAFWVSEPDRGQTDAINKGWQRSSGDILGWINSDDILLPGAVSCVVNFFNLNPDIGYVYGDLDILNENGQKISTETYTDFDLKQAVKEVKWISQPGSFMKRDIFEKVGLLDTSLHFQMDFDYWLRAGIFCRFGYTHTPLAGFRHHPDSKSMSRTYLAAQDILTIYDKFFAQPNLPVEFKEIQAEARANAHLYSAQAHALSGGFQKASSELMNSVRAHLTIPLRPKFWKTSLYIGRLFMANLLSK